MWHHDFFDRSFKHSYKDDDDDNEEDLEVVVVVVIIVVIVVVCIYSTSSLRAGCDTRSIFKRSTAGLN